MGAAGQEYDNEYLSLYRSRLRSLIELTRPAFQRRDGDAKDAMSTRKSSRTSEQLQLTPLSVLYVKTMIAPLRRLYSWGVPTSEALDCIEEAVNSGSGGEGAASAGVVEVGAGTGYWASLLRRRGIPVTAYDLHPCHDPEPNGHHKLLGRGNPPPFTEVTRGGAEAAANYDDDDDEDEASRRVLMLCWPPREDPVDEVRSDVSGMAATALRSFRGDTIVYVGEVSEVEKEKEKKKK